MFTRERVSNSFGKELGENKPFSSQEACQSKCEENKKCLQWRYDPFKEYCELSDGTKLTAGLW